MQEVDSVIIGAGVVGLSIARELSLRNKKILVIEANDKIGSGASLRNSEVIHAGIYYPPNSLKAKLCVEGKELLYKYCEEKNIPYQKIGKLIVADKEEVHKLKDLEQNAKKSGVFDLEFLDKARVQEKEPEVSCDYGLFSPSTGVFHLQKFMQSLAQEIGDVILFSNKVEDIQMNDRYIIQTNENKIKTKSVINAAGLFTTFLLQKLEFFPKDKVPEQFYCKGSYCLYEEQNIFNHLVYPMPKDGGLGIHSTIDMDGNLKFGPDTEWITKPDYSFDNQKIDIFYEEIKKYWPKIQKEKLLPGFAGIRTKLSRYDFCDFIIQTENEHNLPGWVNLLGIESPGITAAMAIAIQVADGL